MSANPWERSSNFWDNKARENPHWYISSYGRYEQPEDAGFWTSGTKIWDDIKRATSYEPQAQHTVVEIGCGIGRLTRAIAPEVGRVLAFDISQEMLARARSGGPPNAAFFRTSGNSLAEAPDGAADAAVAYCVFQHLPTLDGLRDYLREMYRVTRLGGLIVFSLTPRTLTDAPVFSQLMRLRRMAVESLRRGGPAGLYRKEWYGIRPSRRNAARLAPLALSFALLHGDKWLFYAKKPL